MIIVASMASIFRDYLLKDRVAFVTGGGSGIGQRMAERFAEHGAQVVLVGRNQEKLDAAAAIIRDAVAWPQLLRWMSATTRRWRQPSERRAKNLAKSIS